MKIKYGPDKLVQFNQLNVGDTFILEGQSDVFMVIGSLTLFRGTGVSLRDGRTKQFIQDQVVVRVNCTVRVTK